MRGEVWRKRGGCGVVRAMRLVTVLNRCYRFKGFVYEDAGFCTERKDVVQVRVRAREGSRAYCSGCGKRCAGYDRLLERRFEFIPLWGFVVFFLYARRRVQCRDCGIVAELLPWAEGVFARVVRRARIPLFCWVHGPANGRCWL